MRRITKKVSFTLLLLFSGTLLGTHQFGLFPGVLLFAFLSLSTVIGASAISKLHWQPAVCFIIGTAVIYRLIIFLYPTTLIGVDTDKKAYWTSEVIRLGSIEGINSSFYQNAPLFHTHTSGVAEIANVTVITSFVIYPLLVGILGPLIAVILTQWMHSDSNEFALVIAGSIAAVSTALVQQSYWPISQTYSFLVWCVLLISLVYYIKTRSWQPLIIFTLCVVALSYSHKLPVVIVLGLLLFTLIVSYLLENRFHNLNLQNVHSIRVRPEIPVLLLTILLLFSHWNYVSNYLSDVVRRIMVLFATGSAAPPSAPSLPTEVEPVNPGIIGQVISYPNSLSLFFERSHAVVLLLVAGVFWAHILYQTAKGEGFDRTTTSILLGGAAFSVLLTGIGIISIGSLNPNRPLFMIEPILAVLIAAGIVSILKFRGESTSIPTKRKSNMKLGLGVTITILLIFTQVFAAPAIPDYPNTPRYYLAADEVEGKSFSCEYASGEIRADYYLSQERYTNGNYCDSFRSMDRYADGQPLFNGTAAEQGYETIAYRTDVDVYLGTHSRWKLTWEPESEFEEKYNKAYANGGYHLYTK